MLKLTLTKDDPQNTLILIACVHNSSYVMMMGTPSCTWWRAIVNWQLIGQETSSSFVKASDNNGTAALQLELTRQICRQKSRRQEAKQPIWSKSKTDSSEFLPLSGWGEVVGGAKREREKQADPLPMRKTGRSSSDAKKRSSKDIERDGSSLCWLSAQVGRELLLFQLSQIFETELSVSLFKFFRENRSLSFLI